MRQDKIKEYLNLTDTDDTTSMMGLFKEIVSVAKENNDMWRYIDFSVYTECPSYLKIDDINWCAKISYLPVLPDDREGEAIIYRAEAESVSSALKELAEKVVNDERQ